MYTKKLLSKKLLFYIPLMMILGYFSLALNSTNETNSKDDNINLIYDDPSEIKECSLNQSDLFFITSDYLALKT
jgi:hypothetical protein